MKLLSKLLALFSIALVFSCGGSLGNAPVFDSKESVNKFITLLNEKFTPEAGYMQVIVTYDKQIGNTVIVQATKDINSNKVEEWVYTSGVWQQKSEITMEVPEGTTPADFMFQLKDVGMANLADMVTKAKTKVTTEKEIKEVICTTASFTMPDRRQSEDKLDDINRSITIAPENGGTNFNCFFDPNGEILDMSY